MFFHFECFVFDLWSFLSPSCVVDVTATSDGNAIRFVTLTSSNVACKYFALLLLLSPNATDLFPAGVQSKRGPRSLGTVVYLYKVCPLILSRARLSQFRVRSMSLSAFLLARLSIMARFVCCLFC